MANPDYTAQDVPTWAANLDSMNSLKAVGNVGNPLLFLPLLNSLAFAKGIGSLTFVRASVATYIDRYGVLQIAAIDEPRFEKNGFLIEGARTNLFQRSQEADNVYWTKIRTSITPNDQTGPDGNATMDKLVEDNTTGAHILDRAETVTSGAEVALSVVARPDTRSSFAMQIKSGATLYAFCVVNLAAGTIRNVSYSNGAAAPVGNESTIEAVANGCFRVSIPVDLPGGETTCGAQLILINGSGSSNYLGDGVSGLWIEDMQLEEGSFASSIIRTTGAPVTRTAETLILSIAGNIGLQVDAGAILVDCNIIGLQTGATPQSALIIGGETSRTIKLKGASSTPISHWADKTIVGTTRVPFTPYRLGNVFDGTTASAWVNGVKDGSDSTPTAFDVLGNAIHIGMRNLNNETLFGHITNVRIYEGALSDREMAVA